ncbi:MAG: flagellar basal body L-ring protein FlgH [Nitrospira sp.]|nr:flagellar basal body L-ring protein FlgH [Nitrospira sp.]
MEILRSKTYATFPEARTRGNELCSLRDRTWFCRRLALSYLCAAVVLLLQGCASPPDVSSKITVAPLPPPKTVGSLWQEENGRAYLYEDLRAMRTGDILTVKIVENHKGSKSADTEVQRESTIKNSLVGSALGYIGIPGIRFSDETRRGMGIDASANSKFGGKGATSRTGTLTGTISAIVTEVLPNGDLRIEGRREVNVNSEKQLMSIGGIVRRVDVDTKNTVLSSAIADAKIEYSGLGVLDDVQRPGWFVRILDWIYPF